MSRFLSLHPLVIPVLAFMAGIGLAEGMDALFLPIQWPLVLLAAGLFCALFSRLRWHGAAWVCLLLLMMLLGCCRMELKKQEINRLPVGSRHECSAVVFSVPRVSERTVTAELLLTDGSHAHQLVHAVFVGDTMARNLTEGNGLCLSAVMQPAFLPSAADGTAPSSVYPYVLRSKDIHLVTFLYPGQWQRAAVDFDSFQPAERLRYHLLCLRRHLLRELRQSGLHADAYDLGAAMMLGVRQQVSAPVRRQYADAGVSHLLALSGMHLSVIYLLVTLLFGRYRRSMVAEVLVVAVMWFYAMLTGLGPSVLRAVMLVSVSAVIRLAGRRPVTLNSLSFVALIQLLWQPLSLFDVSFQLSYLAVASILIAYPPLYGMLSDRFVCLRQLNMDAPSSPLHHRLLRLLVGMVLLSTVAQIGVAPLSIHYFASFPLFFVVSNLVMVSLAIVMLYALFLILLFSVCPMAAILQTVPVWVFLQLQAFQSAFLTWFAPLGGIGRLHLSVAQTWLCYLLLALTAALFCRLFPKKHTF